MSPVRRRGRRRAVVAVTVLVGLGCAGLVVAAVGGNQRTTGDLSMPTAITPVGPTSQALATPPPSTAGASASTQTSARLSAVTRAASSAGMTTRQLPTHTTGAPTQGTSTRTESSKSSPAASLRGNRVLAGKTIVIDPGHQLGNSSHLPEIDKLVNGGGFMKACNTTGTSTDAGFPEATFAWDVALALRARLESAGARVVMTRHSNSASAWGPCVDARGRLGNQVHADAVVSIHGDGADPSYRGFFVITPALLRGWTDDIYGSSRRLGVAVHAGLVGAGATVANDYGGTGYSVRSDLGTLNWSNVPVVMVELGNMRNSTDAAHMTSPAYRNTVYARGLATGLTTFLSTAPSH